MNVDFVCKVCSYEASDLKHLIGHFSSSHGLTSKEYYDKYYKTENEGICQCGKLTNYYKLSFGYNKYCNECNSNRCYRRVICKLCNIELGGSGGGLGQHLKYKHKMTSQDYYDNYIKENESEGKCKICGKLTKFLGINRGYNRYCSDKCSSNDLELKERREQINLERYGYRHNWSSPELREKGQYKTNLEKYGTKYPQKLEKTKQKVKDTCIDKYGVDNYAKTEECWDKIKNTCLEQSDGKFTNTSQFPNSIIKSRQTVFNRLLIEKQEQYNGIVNIVGYKKRTIVCHCNVCQNNFDILEETLKLRILNNTIICTNCNPLNGKHISITEKELLDYIKTLYDGEIIENDRCILNGKELDIYLPDLKLGFEFDGTYWHADPRFYNANDLIKEMTAEKIWERDKQKDMLCESVGIKLFRINEYDWNENNSEVKNNIGIIIKNKIHN